MKSNSLTHIGLAVLRILPSLMMLAHGFPKFKKLIAGNFEFGNPIGIGEAPSLFLAVVGEFIAPILIIIGYKTKFAAIPSLITMLVAAFIVHASDPFGTKEKALLYAVFFIAIILLGPGKYSLDKK